MSLEQVALAFLAHHWIGRVSIQNQPWKGAKSSFYQGYKQQIGGTLGVERVNWRANVPSKGSICYQYQLIVDRQKYWFHIARSSDFLKEKWKTLNFM